MKSSKVNNCSWFDSENARLIILCATLGVFGVHKFVQHKNFQGILYILLDLTIVGIILTIILSWIDLIFLTAKSDNRPGNMILGAMFILFESLVFIPGSSSVVIKKVNPMLTDSNDATISVDAGTEEDTTEISEDANIVSVEDVADMSEEVVEQENDSEMETFLEPVMQPVEENIIEPVKVEDAVVQKAPVKPRVRPQKTQEAETSEENVQHSEEAEFEHFSLYDMVTGS